MSGRVLAGRRVAARSSLLWPTPHPVACRRCVRRTSPLRPLRHRTLAAPSPHPCSSLASPRCTATGSETSIRQRNGRTARLSRNSSVRFEVDGDPGPPTLQELANERKHTAGIRQAWGRGADNLSMLAKTLSVMSFIEDDMEAVSMAEGIQTVMAREVSDAL